MRPRKGNASRKGVGDGRKRHDIGGTGQQPCTGAAIAVNGAFDGQQDVRRTLDLIQDGRRGKSIDETVWVPERGVQVRPVIEGYVSRIP